MYPIYGKGLGKFLSSQLHGMDSSASAGAAAWDQKQKWSNLKFWKNIGGGPKANPDMDSILDQAAPTCRDMHGKDVKFKKLQKLTTPSETSQCGCHSTA